MDTARSDDRTSRPTERDARRRRPGPRSDPIRVSRGLIHVRRAFGEPIVRDDVTLVPVARVVGGSGFGGGDGEWEERGTDRAGVGSGSGGGLGVGVSPVGVYVVRGSQVSWEPAFDLNRAVLGGQLLGALVVLVIARALRRRRR